MRLLIVSLCAALALTFAPVISFQGTAPASAAYAQGKDMKSDKDAKAKPKAAKKKAKKPATTQKMG